jgi:hypothetical protein
MGSAEIGSGPIGDVLRGASAAMRAGPGLAAGINGSAVATVPTDCRTGTFRYRDSEFAKQLAAS